MTIIKRKNRPIRIRPLSPHFQMLGLPEGECRGNAIREAAQNVSVSLVSTSTDSDSSDVASHEADQMRGRVATAVYRLMDPRNRSVLFERVQLVLAFERNEDEEVVLPKSRPMPLKKWIEQLPAPKRPTFRKARVKLMKQPVIEDAIHSPGPQPGESYSRSLAPNDTAIDDMGVSLVEEKRRIVQELRQIKDSPTRTMSPLGWLWNRLGL